MTIADLIDFARLGAWTALAALCSVGTLNGVVTLRRGLRLLREGR